MAPGQGAHPVGVRPPAPTADAASGDQAEADPSATARQYGELLDWRRCVAGLFATWRTGSLADAAGATERFRAERDRLFRDHPQSPLAAAARARFRGLAYWPYDPAYRLTARLRTDPGLGRPHDDAGADGGESLGVPWSDAERSLGFPATTGGSVPVRRLGWLELSGPLAGHRLAAHWIEGYAGGLFVSFRDATSGKETYGAGRYLLDTAKSADHGSDPDEATDLILDFNLAYFPSCAYDACWDCPLPPRENWLDVAVPVGERLAS